VGRLHPRGRQQCDGDLHGHHHQSGRRRAPGTSASPTGYGTGSETGVTVNVVSGATNTVTGTSAGVYLGDATVTNNAGASITGGMIGIAALASDAALTTASAEIKWLNGWSVAATFEGEFSDVTRSYAGKGVVRYAW
jgi:hypothetical protein